LPSKELGALFKPTIETLSIPVEPITIFESFAAAFESSLLDDDWSRLEKYLAEDATYLNVGGPDPKCIGRAEYQLFEKRRC
jgi:hypothetical protein